MTRQTKTGTTAVDNNWLSTLTGARVRIRTPGAETNQLTTVIEFVEPANSSPPVFTRHQFIEVFCVLDGVLAFQFIDEPQVDLSQGQSVTCPSWKPHSFWNETSTPAKVLLICSPAGLDEFFIESDRLLCLERIQAGNSHTDKMKTLRDRYGIEHVGVPPQTNKTP